MKFKYYVNEQKQYNGDHEVHTDTCVYFSRIISKRYLGEFDSCHEAVKEAGKYHGQVNGCVTCCRPCHTS